MKTILSTVFVLLTSITWAQSGQVWLKIQA
jgi:hypothetical protein